MKTANKVGGGARTNELGLEFEQLTSIEEAFNALPEYLVKDSILYKQEVELGIICSKHGLYTKILEPRGIDYKKILSKKLLPDEAVLINTTVYIIEKKFQSGPGSVDEKLQTCDFKRKQYLKLFRPLGINVQYIYLLNDWFKKDEYRDVREYIIEVQCKFFFNKIPIEFFIEGKSDG